MKEYKIVEVEWIDAQSGFSSPIESEDFKNIKPLLTYSVGYLLKEDDESILLGFMLFDENQTLKHWQLIPKGMVKKITEFFPKVPKIKPAKRWRI